MYLNNGVVRFYDRYAAGRSLRQLLRGRRDVNDIVRDRQIHLKASQSTPVPVNCPIFG
jgi:hypothetical protein